MPSYGNHPITADLHTTDAITTRREAIQRITAREKAPELYQRWKQEDLERREAERKDNLKRTSETWKAAISRQPKKRSQGGGVQNERPEEPHRRPVMETCSISAGTSQEITSKEKKQKHEDAREGFRRRFPIYGHTPTPPSR